MELPNSASDSTRVQVHAASADGSPSSNVSDALLHWTTSSRQHLTVSNVEEATPLLNKNVRESSLSTRATTASSLLFSWKMSNHWIPARWEEESHNNNQHYKHHHHHHTRQHHHHRTPRSLKRRIFLFLTEPDSSVASAAFFVLLLICISAMNVVMMMQTMSAWQFTPDDCRTCGGPTSYLFDDDNNNNNNNQPDCVCPPTPLPWTETFLNGSIYFFSVEWVLRVITFEPPARPYSTTTTTTTMTKCCHWWWQWLGFLTSPTTVLDALAIFPYYAELSFETNGLMSLRLLRLFRVFQLVRLGQYNESFMSLTTVMVQSIPYLKLLLGVLVFGAAFFGSIIYWIEKGDWQYHAATDSYAFVRYNNNNNNNDHVGEISPFSSIPAAFWWFLVTATTVGYGDVYPTSTSGKWVAAMAMLMGLLVIAFPVSVFSDLWSKELRKSGLRGLSDVLVALDEEDEEEDDEQEEEYDVKQEANKDSGGSGGKRNGSGDYAAMGMHRNHNGAVMLQNGDDEESNLLAPTSRNNGRGTSESEPELGTVSYHHHHRPLATTAASAEQHFQESSSSHRGFTLSDADDLLVLRKSDMAELMAHMQSIHESQRHIRSILRKYRIPVALSTTNNG